MKKILIGGSPCTKWSIANKNRETTKINFPNTIFFNNAFDVRNENSELYKYLISL